MKADPIALRRILFGIFACLFLWSGGAAYGQAPSQWEVWDGQASVARSAIENGRATAETLAQIRSRIDAQDKTASEISKKAAEEIRRLEAELDALGPPPEVGQEETAAAALRAELTGNIAEARARKGRADRVVARAADIRDDITALDQRRFVNRLETLSPSPARPARWVEAFAFLGKAIGTISEETDDLLSSESARELAMRRAPLAALAIVAALFIGFGVRIFAVGAIMRQAEKSPKRKSRLLIGIGATAARVIFLAAASALLLYGLSATGLFGLVGRALLEGLSRGIGALIIGYALAAALFSPTASGLRPYALDDAVARRGFWLTMLIAGVIAIDLVLSRVTTAMSATSAISSVYTFVMILIGALALWRLASLARPLTHAVVEGGEAPFLGIILRYARRAAVVVAILSPVLALIGYEFAARFLFFPSVLSFAIIAVLGLIFTVVRESVEIHLSTSGEGVGERLRLIPIFAGFVLLCVSLPALALVWGASWEDLARMYRVLADGLVIGEVAISPMDFVMFALVFGLGYTITRAAQRVLKGSVLPKAGMSTGGADALASGVGYLGVFLAALAAISATGLDLSNLAIVAGALSVGIGFGLQNIVNNFVSGVILLVERPIKVGDWIEVGGVHGTVKKVNVRSTEIETFDRASYILPNSDLISGAVTNYTHSNTTGRVIIPVGVAYGTDTRLVEKLLLEAAVDHPMLLSSPAPVAYFMNFGADALEFELRGYLRDVNWVISVKSDLNFRIEEKMREAGIEIPFAQRDLHLRNVDALAAALRAGDRNGDRRNGNSGHSSDGRSDGAES